MATGCCPRDLAAGARPGGRRAGDRGIAVLARLRYRRRTLAGWLAGWLADALLLALLLALVQAFHLARVRHWAALPGKRDVPLGSGGWGLVLDRPARVAHQQSEDLSKLKAELAKRHSAVDSLPRRR